MKDNRWRFLALATLLVGCARTVTGTQAAAPSTEAPVTEISVETEVEPVSPDASTPAAATTVATTVPEYSCADFEALQGFERMMAVEQGGAPTDAACEEAVDRSAAALFTYEAGLEFSEQFDAADSSEFMEAELCREPALITNIFDLPVIFWGLTAVVEDDEVISYEPYVTEVLEPGATASVDFAGIDNAATTLECTIYTEGIVAPAGDLIFGIDGAPAPATDLLASDDVVVWAGALFGEYSPDLEIAEVVNRIEDIHSPDVGGHLRTLESGRAEADDDSATYTVCDWTPADLGPEVGGQFMWVVVAEQSSRWDRHHLGLFSRGSDSRWRFLGSTAVIDETVDPKDPCAVAAGSLY